MTGNVVSKDDMKLCHLMLSDLINLILRHFCLIDLSRSETHFFNVSKRNLNSSYSARCIPIYFFFIDFPRVLFWFQVR